MQNVHEGISQVNQSNINMLITLCEIFKMNKGEFIQDMHTRFTSIVIEVECLRENIKIYKRVKKVLSILLSLCESKVNSILEEKDLQTMMMEELIGNLKMYELKSHQDFDRNKPKTQKNLVLKMGKNDK